MILVQRVSGMSNREMGIVHGMELSTSLHCLTLRSLWFECLFFLFWGSVSGAYGWMGNEGGNLGRGYIGRVLGERFYD